MRILRIFIKPAGTSWCDFPLPENATMHQVLPQARLDGMFVHERAAIPWDGMLFAAILDLPDNTQLSMVVPSGKPN